MTEDQQLLHEYAAEGSRPALEKLITRHLGLVYSSAQRQVRDPHLAEDVTQAVFLILSIKARTIKNRAVVSGWLLTVTRCTALNAMRKRAIQRKHEAQAARAETGAAGADADPHRAADEWAQIAPFLDAELNRLPSADRSALVLRFFEDRTFAQTGAELGISEEAARKRVTRALRRLRQALNRRKNVRSAGELESALALLAGKAAPEHLLAAAIRASTNPSSACKALAKGGLAVQAWTNARLIGKLGCAAMLAGMIVAIGCGLGKSSSPRNRAPAGPMTVTQVVLLTKQPAGDATADSPATPPNEPAATQPAGETVYSVVERDRVIGQADMVRRLIQSESSQCTVNADGTRSVYDWHTGESVIYDDRARTAVMTAGTIDPRSWHPQQSMEQRFAEIVRKGARHTGSERTDGKNADTYVFDEEGRNSAGIQVLPTHYLIWIDKASGRVVRAASSSSAGKLKMAEAYTNFEVNPTLPANMLSIVPPRDYKVTTPSSCVSGCTTTPDLGAHITKHLFEIVRDGLRPKNGATRFPEDLDAVSGYIRLDNSDVPGIKPNAAPGHWYARVNIGRSLADLPADAWSYPGIGKPRGKADELIFWCKTPEGCKGMYGDLSVKDLEQPPQR